MTYLLISQIILLIVRTPYTLAITFETFRRDGRIISLHRSENWTTAMTTCYNRGETLASVDDLKNLDSDIWEQQTLLDNELWTINTYIYTPFIAKIGCYQLEGEPVIAANLEVYGNTSIAVCYAYCSGSQYFALLGFNCICNLSRNITRKRMKNCESYGSMERKKTLEVYEVETEDASGRNSEGVYFKVCECRYELRKMKAIHHIVSKQKMSKNESYYGACFSSKKELVLLSNSFPNWESADLACRKFTGQPLAAQLNESQCRTLSKKTKEVYGNAIIMTGKRTYHSQIHIEDVFHSGAFGFVNCKIVNLTRPYNWTGFESPKEITCNAGKKHFICIKDIERRIEQGYDSNLIFKIMTPGVCLLALTVIAYIKCRNMKQLKGANQEKKGRPNLEASDPCSYNHTESSRRISMKQVEKVYTCDSEDSGEDSYFSEDCVESESQNLNEEVVAARTILSDDSCNYSFASACQHTPLQDIPAGATVSCLANGAIPQDNRYKPKTLFAKGTMANEIL